MQKLSSKLVELRKTKGLTQKQLAEKINYSDKVISKWERGDSVPDISALSALAGFYGITLDDIMSSCETTRQSAKSDLKKVGGLFHILLAGLPLLFSILYLCIFNYSYFGVHYVHDLYSILTVTPMCLLAAFVILDLILSKLRISRMWVVYTIFGIIGYFVVLLVVSSIAHGSIVSVKAEGINYTIYSVLAAIASTAFGSLLYKN